MLRSHDWRPCCMTLMRNLSLQRPDLTARMAPVHVIKNINIHTSVSLILPSTRQHDLNRLENEVMYTAQVCFEFGVPLQSGLEALRVLEVVRCEGPLCIACALPALQASAQSIHALSHDYTFA